jgi:hypothetical protein
MPESGTSRSVRDRVGKLPSLLDIRCTGKACKTWDPRVRRWLPPQLPSQRWADLALPRLSHHPGAYAVNFRRRRITPVPTFVNF